jgi:hypothetical protein
VSLAGSPHVSTPAQPRTVRVSPGGLGADLRAILPVDLPVDWIIVLEQEERAGQLERFASALHERRFVR